MWDTDAIAVHGATPSDTCATPQAMVDEWLTSGKHDQKLSEAALAAAGEHVTSVVSPIHCEEELVADPPAAELPGAPPAEPPVFSVPQQLSPRRLHPLQIDDDLVLHTAMPAVQAVTAAPTFMPARGKSLDTAAASRSAAVSGQAQQNTPAIAPTAFHQSALQGASARNQAAVAAHRARLKEHFLASAPDSAAARHGWAQPVKKSAASAGPTPAAPQRSSLQGYLHSPSGRTSTPAASSRPPGPSMTCFSLHSARSLSPPVTSGVPQTSQRGETVALPATSIQSQRRSLALAQGWPLSTVTADSMSPNLQRHGSQAVTIAEIMQQNGRLLPLSPTPSAPVSLSASSALSPLPPLRRGVSAVPFAAATAEDASALRLRSSPQWWSQPPPGHGHLLSQHSSVTFLPELRHNIKLDPISPARTGSGIPLERGASGAQRSPNRCNLQLQLCVC